MSCDRRGNRVREWVGVGILFQSDGKTSEGSERENDVIRFALLKDPSGCCVKNGKEWGPGGDDDTG